MSNIQSKLSDINNKISQCPELKENKIVNKVLSICKEYETVLEKYNDLTTGPIYNIINKSKSKDEITKLIDEILYTEHSEYIKDTVNSDNNGDNDINNGDNNDGDNTNEISEDVENKLKKLCNLFIDQLSQIRRRELIDEGIEIMMKQININTEQATQFLVENNFDPVDAILAYMNHKPTNEAQTYFTFQLNQHELVNELVSISNKLSGIEFYDKDTITELMSNKVQSFVCIQINNKNNLKKIKKYSSVSELYKLFVSENTDRINIAEFPINNEKFGLLYSDENIFSSIDEKITPQLNDPITVILRNIEVIKKDEFYSGPALFINNFFLN